MGRLPSLRLLTGFEAAARLGNFSRAAEELSLSQSAISHQIQQLEQQLGQPLFHRVGRGVELTVAGVALLKTVQTSLRNLHQGITRISTYLEPGIVTVVCPSCLAQGWLQSQLSALQADIPDLLPIISVDETARYIDELDVDMVIGEQPLQQPNLHEQKLFDEVWLMVAATAHSRQWQCDDAAQLRRVAPLICLEQSFADEYTASFLMQELAGCRRLAIYDDASLVLQGILREPAMACLPLSVVWHSLQSGVLQVLPGFPQIAGKSWWISRMQGDTRDKRVLKVFTALLRSAPQLKSVSENPAITD